MFCSFFLCCMLNTLKILISTFILLLLLREIGIMKENLYQRDCNMCVYVGGKFHKITFIKFNKNCFTQSWKVKEFSFQQINAFDNRFLYYK